MKNIFKYAAASAAMILSLSACEEMVDYQTVIDAAPKLAYVHPQAGDTFETLVVHRPVGSTGSFFTEFQVSANTTDHPEVAVEIAYDAALVAGYNEKHGTSYAALPEEYLEIENALSVIPENADISADTVRVRLSETADLSKLTERAYLAPYKVVSSGLKASEQMGNLWFIVNTEINLIRPVTSADDMVGFPAGGTSAWTADCDNYANLFDGSNSTGVNFSNSRTNVLTIDMKESIMVTGLKLNTNQLNGLSIEYSEDGVEWSQAGTPVDGEYSYNGSSWSAGDYYAAVYDYFTARYLCLSFRMSSSWSASVNDISVYMIESSEPTVYAMTGADNVVSGKIVHKKGIGSVSDFEASFKAYVTVSSESGYNVTASVDNSLISAYNQKHGTSYKAMPSSNVAIQNSSLSIAAGDNASDGNVVLSLTGDLSSLNDNDGYLIPVKLAASGAVVSENRGTVYAVITSETNVIRAISSVDEIVGFPAGGRSSWSSPTDGASALFDDNTGTSMNFQSSGNVLEVNMGDTRLVTGLQFYTYQLNGLNVQYSLDGSTWTSAGTVADGEAVYDGSSWRAGNYYVAFADYIEARYIKLSFGFSGYYSSISEFSVYEIESTEPTIYTVCGADNTFFGKITHHAVAGSSASLTAEFNAMTTVSSADGYAVGAEVDASLVSAYNSKNGTSYATLDASYVGISGTPCLIGSGENKSAGTISISVIGDVSVLKNKNGYLIPVQLKAPSGAVVSEGRGVVYAVLEVEESDALFMSGFAPSAIAGNLVADRSGWKILECDEEGVHSGAYDNLFDGDTETYIRTWGGPVTFTVDLGAEYDMTGLVITARTDGGYSQYQPTSIQIMASLDNGQYDILGTAASSEGTLVSSVPSSYVAFYGSRTVRYLKIEAGYGSNMGTAEFNIYVK